MTTVDLDNDDEPGPCPRCRALQTAWIGGGGNGALCVTCGFIWDGCDYCCLTCGYCMCRCDGDDDDDDDE